MSGENWTAGDEISEDKLNNRKGYNRRVRVYLGTHQTISVETPVAFDTEIYDDNNDFNVATHVYTVPEDGLYLIIARVRWETIAAGDQLYLKIYKDSTEVATVHHYAEKAGYWSQHVSDILELSAGDEITIRVYQVGQTSLDIRSGEKYSTLTIQRLS